MSILTQTADLTTSIVNGTFNPLQQFGISLNEADQMALKQINSNVNQAKPQYQTYFTPNTAAKANVVTATTPDNPTTAVVDKMKAMDWQAFGQRYFWWIAAIGFLIIVLITGFFGMFKKG